MTDTVLAGGRYVTEGLRRQAFAHINDPDFY